MNSCERLIGVSAWGRIAILGGKEGAGTTTGHSRYSGAKTLCSHPQPTRALRAALAPPGPAHFQQAGYKVRRRWRHAPCFEDRPLARDCWWAVVRGRVGRVGAFAVPLCAGFSFRRQGAKAAEKVLGGWAWKRLLLASGESITTVLEDATLLQRAVHRGFELAVFEF